MAIVWSQIVSLNKVLSLNRFLTDPTCTKHTPFRRRPGQYRKPLLADAGYGPYTACIRCSLHEASSQCRQYSDGPKDQSLTAAVMILQKSQQSLLHSLRIDSLGWRIFRCGRQPSLSQLFFPFAVGRSVALIQFVCIDFLNRQARLSDHYHAAGRRFSFLLLQF